MKAAMILLAMQDHEPRVMLRVDLQLMGFLVGEAAGGQAALRILREEPPDLMLLDLAIPIVGSIAILAELRAMRARTRVVTLARPNDIPTAIESVRLGASDFLEKPISADDVMASIASVLNDAPPRDYLTDEKLGLIRTALRNREFSKIEAALRLPARNTEAGFLNLAGTIHESHGRIARAQEFYARALAADERYEPAQRNLERLAALCRYDDRIHPPFPSISHDGLALMIP